MDRESYFEIAKKEFTGFVIEETGLALYAVDFNFFVRSILNFLRSLDVLNWNILVNQFGVFSTSDNRQIVKNNKFLVYIFETFWNLMYINGGKTPKQFMKYSIIQVYENESGPMHFSSILFVKSALLKLFNDEELINFLDMYGGISEAEQVASGEKN